jgi:hypothetical protein
MKARWAVAGVLCALALAGCIDTSTKISVSPDGSGTIEKTLVLSRHLAEIMASMGNKGDPAAIEQGILNEKGLKAEASQMGPGVAFVSAQKITTSKGNGYHVLYSFKDISKLKLNQSPSADLTVPTGGTSGAAGAAAENLTFTFTRGSPATLTIIAPKPAASTAKPPAGPAPGSADADKMMATLRPLYSDMRIVVTVEVAGTITATNATYASGSTVTLVDMDFGTILADDASFKKLSATRAGSITELRSMVKSLPGVRLDTQDTVRISFK